MGAHNIETYQSAKSMQEAYDLAYEHALDESGRNAYNGTISTTAGFIDKTSEFTTEEEWNEKALENTDKWGAVWGRECEKLAPWRIAHEVKDNNDYHDYVFVGWASC